MKYIATKDGPVCPNCYHPAPERRCDCRAAVCSRNLTTTEIEGYIMKDQEQEIDQLRASLAAIRAEIRKLMTLAVEEPRASPNIEPADPVELDGWKAGRKWANNPSEKFPRDSGHPKTSEDNAKYWEGFSNGADSVEKGSK